MDLSAVRAEIKAWERSFKSSNGRVPSVQDVKGHPEIADKYKLYKRLSKLAALPEADADRSASTTPPCHSALPPKRHVVETSPTKGFNPFSPSKDRRKRAEPTSRTASNPFATPVKIRQDRRSPSPDLFPPIQMRHVGAAASLTTPSLPSISDPITRARKRLRGDPVSPSPDKEKRRRVTPQPFPFWGSQDPAADREEEEPDEVDWSVLENSPIKPLAAGTKSFQSLFNEGTPVSSRRTGRDALERSKTVGALFNDRTKSSGLNWLTGLDGNRKIVNGKSIFLSARIPPKDDLFAPEDAHGLESELSKADNGKPSKRTLGDVDTSADSWHTYDSAAQRVPIIQLLRPSPPPVDPNTSKYKGKGKHKVPANTSRKKAKLGDHGGESSDEDDNNDIDKVKVINPFRRIRSFTDNDVAIPDFSQLGEDVDEDSILSRVTALRECASGSKGGVVQEEPGAFDVDLPKNLHRVLALSPSKSKSTTLKDDVVVRNLLSGSRRGDYEAEIWGIGETTWTSDVEGSADEDEWEGEGVPWEVGAL